MLDSLDENCGCNFLGASNLPRSLRYHGFGGLVHAIFLNVAAMARVSSSFLLGSFILQSILEHSLFLLCTCHQGTGEFASVLSFEKYSFRGLFNKISRLEEYWTLLQE
jgi:hypothetical protein